jgi:NAD(P)H-flavin reductase
LAAQLSKKKNKVIALLGFRSSDRVFGEDIFRKLRIETIVTTDDGSYGLKGFVSDHLEKSLNRSVSHAYVCGPNPMLKAVLPMIRKSRNQGVSWKREWVGLWRLSLLCGQYSWQGVVERRGFVLKALYLILSTLC